MVNNGKYVVSIGKLQHAEHYRTSSSVITFNQLPVGPRKSQFRVKTVRSWRRERLLETRWCCSVEIAEMCSGYSPPVYMLFMICFLIHIHYRAVRPFLRFFSSMMFPSGCIRLLLLEPPDSLKCD